MYYIDYNMEVQNVILDFCYVLIHEEHRKSSQHSHGDLDMSTSPKFLEYVGLNAKMLGGIDVATKSLLTNCHNLA